MFPDVERLLVLWARTQADLVKAAQVETPTDFTTATTPFLRVTALGGPRDGVTGSGTYDLDMFSPTRNTSRDALEALIERIKPRLRLGSAIIDSVTTRVSPRQERWDNTKIVRFSATLVIATRR